MTDNRTTERVDHPPRVREAIDELMREKDATDNRTTELAAIVEALAALASAITWTQPNCTAAVESYLKDAWAAIDKLEESWEEDDDG